MSLMHTWTHFCLCIPRNGIIGSQDKCRFSINSTAGFPKWWHFLQQRTLLAPMPDVACLFHWNHSMWFLFAFPTAWLVSELLSLIMVFRIQIPLQLYSPQSIILSLASKALAPTYIQPYKRQKVHPKINLSNPILLLLYNAADKAVNSSQFQPP